MQEGARAELEGVTFIGSTDVGAAENAPAISMMLSHQALVATSTAHVHMRGDMPSAFIVSVSLLLGCRFQLTLVTRERHEQRANGICQMHKVSRNADSTILLHFSLTQTLPISCFTGCTFVNGS
jgi:hypothetical protein